MKDVQTPNKHCYDEGMKKTDTILDKNMEVTG